MSFKENDYQHHIDPSTAKPDLLSRDPLHDPWRIKPLTVSEFVSLSQDPQILSSEQLAYLGLFNVISPTSHNTVQQRLRREDNSIELWVDRKFVLPASDGKGRESVVSIGAGMANLVVAGQVFGLDPQVELYPIKNEATYPHKPSEDRYTALGRVRFTPGAGELLDPLWLQAMCDRKVVRAEYDESIKLPKELIDQMHKVASLYPHLKLHLIFDKLTLVALGGFQERADSSVFNWQKFALELGEWLLSNDSASEVGMRGRDFGLNDQAAYRMHKGLLGQLPEDDRLLPDEIAGFARAGNLGIRSSPAAAVITVAQDTTQQRIEAGILYEQIALLLMKEGGFYTSLHGGIVEVEGLDGLSSIAAVPHHMLKARLRDLGRRPTVVFRMGKPRNPNDALWPHSVRPPLAHIALPDEVSR